MFDHWQRYSWTGGPHASDDPPAFPSNDWQANVQGDPHGIGVGGAYFRSHGNSGNGDWFYLESVTKTVTHEAVTHVVDHPAVTCPTEEPTDTPTTDIPTETPTSTPPVVTDPPITSNPPIETQNACVGRIVVGGPCDIGEPVVIEIHPKKSPARREPSSGHPLPNTGA